MATIVDIRTAAGARSGRPSRHGCDQPGPGRGAEILLFTGIRHERPQDGAAARSERRSIRRDRLELDD